MHQAPGERQITGILKVTPDLNLIEYGAGKGLQNRMLSIKESPLGTIYCAGIGESTYLYQYDPYRDEFINISAEMKFDYGENFEMHSIDIGHDSTIWLGSTAGLLRYKEGKIERIKFDELVDSEVIAVVAAMDGTV